MSDPLNTGEFLRAWIKDARDSCGERWSIRLICDELERRLDREQIEHSPEGGSAPGGALARRERPSG